MRRRCLVWILAVTLTVPSVAGGPEPPGSPGVAAQRPAGRTIRIVAGGDVMIYGVSKRAAREQARRDGHQGPPGTAGFHPALAGVRPVTTRADLSVVNLETPLLPGTRADLYRQKGSSRLRLVAPTGVAPALAAAGFTVVTLANNHSLDQGTEGIRTTIDAVRAAGLHPVGAGLDAAAARAPATIDVGGLTVAVLGMTGFLNEPRSFDPREPQVAMIDQRRLPAIAAQIQDLRRRVDLIVVTIHWGQQNGTRPRARERGFARALAAAGVDLVVGHHPHVLQAPEVLRGPGGRPCVVAYSLGNLLAGSPSPAWHRGALLIVEAIRGGGPTGRRAVLTGFGYAPTMTRSTRGDARVILVDEHVRELAGLIQDARQEPQVRARAAAERSATLDACARIERVMGPRWVDLAGRRQAAMAAPVGVRAR